MNKKNEERGCIKRLLSERSEDISASQAVVIQEGRIVYLWEWGLNRMGFHHGVWFSRAGEG